MNQIQNILQIWLITTEGEVLIKNTPQNLKEIDVNNLTLQSYDFANLLNEIEKRWGILCSENDLKEIYSFKTDCDKNIIKKGYVLKVNLNSPQKELIAHKSSAQFVDYSDFYDEIALFDSSVDFKEAFYSLLEWLDKVYGYTPCYVQTTAGS